MEYEVIIGCEVHVQLFTRTKAFCGCENRFGGQPNSRLCPVCLGLPGALPVANKKMIEYAIMAGLALNCRVAELTKFDRKNYIYPDLPKGYQISQFDMPICVEGYLEIEAEQEKRKIRIHRAHLEEDAGKNLHLEDGSGLSYIDLNRCGTPLLEIVSEPDLRSPEEAVSYVRDLRDIMKFLGVSDCNMEEGSLRCDANINLWIYEEDKKYATPIAEIKNVNSFKSLRVALEYEVERQLEEWQEKRLTIDIVGKVTRGYDERSGTTILQRHKEEASEYRYFPEPDLRPISIPAAWVEKIHGNLPELPVKIRQRLTSEYGLSELDVHYLTGSLEMVRYFQNACSGYQGEFKKMANWICSEVAGVLNTHNLSIDDFSEKVSPGSLRELMELVDKQVISGKIAKNVFGEMFRNGQPPGIIVDKMGLKQIADTGEIEALVDRVMADNAGSVEDFRNGKQAAVKFLMGQVMKLSRGKVNPRMANSILLKKLGGE